MIRFAWLQSRAQTVLALGLLVLLAVVLAITGIKLVHLYDANVVNCAAKGDCALATNSFVSRDTFLQGSLGPLVLCVPALVGIFWGAPLIAREIETGTFRLAWTQGVTRRRWLVVKLGVLGLASTAVAGLLSLMVSWWYSPLDKVNANQYSVFDVRGIVPVGYAAFAFALGATAGVLIRRTLPAMATTLVVFVGARFAVTAWIRPNLVSPLYRVMSLSGASVVGYGSANGGAKNLIFAPPNLPNAWIYSTSIVDKAGHALTPAIVTSTCPDLGVARPVGGALPVAPAGLSNALHSCVAKLSATFHAVVTYQPADRFWELQWLELAVFLGAALILAGLCTWAVRRSLS